MSGLYSEGDESPNPFLTSPPPPVEPVERNDDDVTSVEDVPINRSSSPDEHSKQPEADADHPEDAEPSTSSPPPPSQVKRTDFGYVMLTDRKEKMNEIQVC